MNITFHLCIYGHFLTPFLQRKQTNTREQVCFEFFPRKLILPPLWLEPSATFILVFVAGEEHLSSGSKVVRAEYLGPPFDVVTWPLMDSFPTRCGSQADPLPPVHIFAEEGQSDLGGILFKWSVGLRCTSQWLQLCYFITYFRYDPILYKPFFIFCLIILNSYHEENPWILDRCCCLVLNLFISNLRFKHAVLGTDISYLGRRTRTVSYLFVYFG